MSQVTLNKIVDEFDLDGGKQSFITKELFGSGVLFEFLEPDQRNKIIDIYNDGRMQTWVDSYHTASRNEQELTKHESATPVSHSEEVTVQVVDDDTGEVVEITPELRDEALMMHGQVEGAFWQLANALATIKNKKLYLAIGDGYTRFKDYCADALPFGVRNAYRYALVGEKIGLKLLEGGSDATPVSQKLEQVGIRKLYLLSSKADDEIKKLISEGKINLDGEDLTPDDLADRRVSELKEMLKNANEKAQKAELLEEQKKNLELEKEAVEEEVDALAEFRHRHLERAEHQQDIENTLEAMEYHREQMMKMAARLGYDEEFDPVAREDQKERLVRFLNVLADGTTRLKNKHGQLMLIINEESQDI